MLPSTFAQLPSAAGVVALERVRARLFDVDLQTVLALPERLDSRVIQEKQNYLLSVQNAKAVELMPSPDRAAQLFDQIVRWEPQDPDSHNPFAASSVRGFNDWALLRAGDILTDVLVPAMEPIDRTEQRARVLLEFTLRRKAWRSLACVPYFIATAPSPTGDMITAIRRSLVGSQHQRVDSAATALMRWGKLIREGVLNELPRACRAVDRNDRDPA